LILGDVKIFAEEYSTFLVKCLKQLSVQIPLIVTLVSLIYESEPEFFASFLLKYQHAVIDAIKSDEIATLKLLLKSAACLTSSSCLIISGSGSFLELLLPFASYVETAIQSSYLDDQAQVSMYLLCHTLLWSVNILVFHEDGKKFLENILILIEKFLVLYVSPFTVSGKTAILAKFIPPEDEELLMATTISVAPKPNDIQNGSCGDNLWEIITVVQSILIDMKSTGGKFEYPSCMLPVWQTVLVQEEGDPIPIAKASFTNEFSQQINEFIQQQHLLGCRAEKCIVEGAVRYEIGDAASVGRSSGWLRNRYAIFAEDTNDEAQACSRLSIVERCIASIYFQDILQTFDPIINNDGTKFGSLELLIGHLLGCLQLFPATANLEYLLVENLFQLIIQVPRNSALVSQASKLILHLTKHHSHFLPIIGLATNIIFQVISDFDQTACRAFADWFSFQFINTQYSWPSWDFWLEYSGYTNDGQSKTELDVDTILTRLFCHHVIQKLSQLVNYDVLKLPIPTAFHSFFDYDEQPKCSMFIENDVTYNEAIRSTASQLKRLVDERVDGEEILDWMENLAALSPEVKNISFLFH
jgi:hypothetical protein